LEEALLFARKIGVDNVVSEVPRSTLCRIHKKLKGKDITHRNAFSRDVGILK
jgi:hypothetical protein